MTGRITIPEELAAEVARDVNAGHGERWLSNVPDDVEAFAFTVDLDHGTSPADESTDPFRSWTCVLAVGSVDGGPRPDFGRDVLALAGESRIVGECGTYINDSGGALVIDCAEHTGTATRWALLPPAVAPQPEDGFPDSPGESGAAETVSQSPRRKSPERCDPSSPETHCGASDCTDHGCQQDWTAEEEGRWRAGEQTFSDALRAMGRQRLAAMNPTPGRWRVGRSWGLTLVEEGTPDRLVGMVREEADAALIVDAVNGVRSAHARALEIADQRDRWRKNAESLALANGDLGAEVARLRTVLDNVRAAVRSPDLTELAKCAAVGLIVNALDPLDEATVRRGEELEGS